MESAKVVTVTLTAGWGDGSVRSINGFAHEEDLEVLKTLEAEFPELLTVVAYPQPVSVDILDFTKHWICGGDDAIHERLYESTTDDFVKAVRKEVAPTGYQGEENANMGNTG